MKLHLHNQNFAKLAGWFTEQHLLDEAQVYTADLLGHRAGEERPEVLCALAFCLRAARQGHAGLWLGAWLPGHLAAELDDPQQQKQLPERLGAAGQERWDELLRDSALVSPEPPDDKPAERPFVLVAGGSQSPDGQAQRLVQLKYFQAERNVAGTVTKLLNDAPGPPAATRPETMPAQLESLLGLALDEQQRRAVEALWRWRLLVLTGGPGTGKTFTVGLLLRAWLLGSRDAGEPPPVALAAPTGKAADRMHRLLGSQGDVPKGFLRFLERYAPRTLHRLLGARPDGSFRYGPSRRLPHRLVIVDESSMVDLLLMQRLLAALADGARLVLVGDADQLASVEVGSVLADLVSGLGDPDGRGNVVRLQRVYRTGSDSPLTLLADKLRHLKDEPDTPEEQKAAAAGIVDFMIQGKDAIEFVAPETSSSGAWQQNLYRPYRPYLEACLQAATGGADSRRHMLEALAGYRILAPFRRGPRGVDRLNALLQQNLAQEFLRLSGGSAGGGWFDLKQRWYAGRAVLIGENRYDLGLFNGDTGVVVPGEDGNPLVVFPSAGDAGSLRSFHPGQLPACETVFATTVHKAQGSEFDQVALVLPAADHLGLSRELVYTAITRARERLLVVAGPDVLPAALLRRVQRASGLPRLLHRRPAPR